MQKIEWTNDYAVGIIDVDEQHHALIDMINALSSCIGTDQEANTTREMLDGLAEYTRTHFALEERLMAEANIDPSFSARHRGEHTYFIGVLRDFSADFSRGKGRISAPLLEYLLHWLLHHIVVTDREMAKHLHSGAQFIYSKKAGHQADSITADLNASELQMIQALKNANQQLEQRLQATEGELAETKAKLVEAINQLSSRQ